MILLLLNGLSEAVLRALFWYTIQACTLFNHSVYAGMIMVLPVVLKALGNNNFTQEGGGGGFAWVNFRWVCAASLSEPLPI